MYTIFISEDYIMKKRALILLPVLIGSLVGCKQAATSGVQADINRAKNLRFNTRYANTIGEETGVDVYGNASNAIMNHSTSVKFVEAVYDEFTYAAEHKYEKTSQHIVYTLYQDYAFQYNRSGFYEEYHGDTHEKIARSSTRANQAYYDISSQIYYAEYVTNGYHNFDAVNLGSYDEQHINNYISSEGLTAAHDYALDPSASCDLYKKKNGYVGFYEYTTEDTYEGIKYVYKQQIIYEFDKDFRIKNGSYLQEEYETYNYLTGQATSNLRCVRSTHQIVEVTYGNRKSKSIIANNIQRLYGKPYINTGYIFFNDLSDYDYTDYYARKTSPTKMRIEGFIFFDNYNNEALDVTPEMYAYVYPSMYNDDFYQSYFEGKLTIKNRNVLKYKNGHLKYTMQYATDALWFKVDCVLSRGKMVFKGGTVEVKNRVDLEDYLYSLYI